MKGGNRKFQLLVHHKMRKLNRTAPIPSYCNQLDSTTQIERSSGQTAGRQQRLWSTRRQCWMVLRKNYFTKIVGCFAAPGSQKGEQSLKLQYAVLANKIQSIIFWAVFFKFSYLPPMGVFFFKFLSFFLSIV